jgi:hypothetical protein
MAEAKEPCNIPPSKNGHLTVWAQQENKVIAAKKKTDQLPT